MVDGHCLAGQRKRKWGTCAWKRQDVGMHARGGQAHKRGVGKYKGGTCRREAETRILHIVVALAGSITHRRQGTHMQTTHETASQPPARQGSEHYLCLVQAACLHCVHGASSTLRTCAWRKQHACTVSMAQAVC